MELIVLDNQKPTTGWKWGGEITTISVVVVSPTLVRVTRHILGMKVNTDYMVTRVNLI